ncbi:MAG: ABC transporter substrate-binding protein [Ruminiclostridium sp.]|nr:ABC transporter substrate-binding protein [Ruminiclostridium sp.]
MLVIIASLSSCGNKPEAGTKETAAAVTTAAAAETTTSAPETTTETTTAAAETEENYDGKLVFDHSMDLKYAKCFSVDYYKGGYKVAKLIDDTTMLIVPEGMSVPAEKPENAIVLQQPVKNILVSSTPVTSLINAIGALDSISLTTYDADSWYIDDVKQAILDGKLTYIGDYKEPDYELITAAGTTFGFFSTMLTDEVKEQLNNIGVEVALDQSAQEDHPLARVEWAKLYGAIFDREENAEEVFNVQDKYVEELSKLEDTGKSIVMFYITSKGVLYARNADDYMSKMIDLAGGQYALSDVGVGETGTAKMELEAFYDKAKDADYIIYIWSMGGKPETLDAFVERASILADMKAVKDGNVWCTTPDYFQIQNTIGSMINDIHLMLEADESTYKLTYLFRIK